MLALVLALVLALAFDPTPAPAPTTGASPPQQTGAAAATVAGGPLTPDQIYSNARIQTYLRSYPRYVTYIIDVQSIAYGRHYHEGYRALLRTFDGALEVKPSPIYSSNQVVDAYGFSFFGLYRTGRPENHIEPPFGVPVLSATYDFGLSESPVSRANLGPREAAIEAIMGPPVLTHVSVPGGDYTISLKGVEDLDGHAVYHLLLKPRFQPAVNRLREVWVDEQTFDVRKLVTQGIFPGGPAAQALWTVTFIDLHGWWFIRTESTDATLRAGSHLFARGTIYHGVHYTFGEYAYPRLISDLEFNQAHVSSDATQY